MGGATTIMAAKGDADELAPFLIRDVEGLTEDCADKEEKRAGFGAYGYVFKVNVKGVERIAKKIHSAYVNQVNPEEKRGITSKFRAECIILSKLRHPNIVQFVGVHYGRGGMTDLTLFMECLSSDMDKFLSSHPNLPLSLKLSLLQDVSFGLVYLHECVPPIIHRDLTARNMAFLFQISAKLRLLMWVWQRLLMYELNRQQHTPQTLDSNSTCPLKPSRRRRHAPPSWISSRLAT